MAAAAAFHTRAFCLDLFCASRGQDMISYFDRILLQETKKEAYVDKQLLQTLVLLFDNISTPTSICECSCMRVLQRPPRLGEGGNAVLTAPVKVRAC